MVLLGWSSDMSSPMVLTIKVNIRLSIISTSKPVVLREGEGKGSYDNH